MVSLVSMQGIYLMVHVSDVETRKGTDPLLLVPHQYLAFVYEVSLGLCSERASSSVSPCLLMITMVECYLTSKDETTSPVVSSTSSWHPRQG